MNNNANRGPEIIYLKSSIHSQTSQPYLLEIYNNIIVLLSQIKVISGAKYIGMIEVHYLYHRISNLLVPGI